MKYYTLIDITILANLSNRLYFISDSAETCFKLFSAGKDVAKDSAKYYVKPTDEIINLWVTEISW